MKKIFKRFSIFVIVGLFLSLGGFVFAENKSKIKSDEAIAYYYETNSQYLYDLYHSDNELASVYNMTRHYPLINENQTDSELCWIYSSMKALESSFMVQTGEYYNFSEVGQGYLEYIYELNNDYTIPAFDTGGTFNSFVQSYQNNGLILESEFSNTELEEVRNNEDRDVYYSYISSLATKEYNSAIKPYQISQLQYFKGLSLEGRRTVLKQFIKQYGAVFAGLEGSSEKIGTVGCFYRDSNATNDNEQLYTFYSPSRASYSYLESYYPLGANHAITIVGWNDDIHFGKETGAFLVMNSWGFESKSYSYFYVPYSYDYIYNTFCGFICDKDAGKNVKIQSASSSSFTTDILKGSAKLNNYFCYDDEISITYKLNISSFKDTEVVVSNGSKTATDFFNIRFNSYDKTATVTLRQNIDEFYGGYYTIRFYNNNLLIGKKSLYIFSGTEIGNFKVVYKIDEDTGALDSYALCNAFLNGDSSATINVAGIRDNYFLSFNLIPPLSYYNIRSSNMQSVVKSCSISISEATIISSSNPALENMYSSEDLVAEPGEVYEQLKTALFVRNPMNQERNEFGIQIGYGIQLSSLKNSLVRFKVSIHSILYENCTKDFYFNMFVSELSYAGTGYLNTIVYELNGGENHDFNPNKYPAYSIGDRVDPNMTSFELEAPTRTGFRFVGWYLNEDFSGDEVTRIDSNLTGNIKLYAKWDENLVDYFYINLEKNALEDFNGTEKDVNAEIVYGDTLTLKFIINPNPDADMSGYNYQVHYYFYGVEMVNGTLASGVNYELFSLACPALTSGTHTFKLKVVVYITQNLTYTTETSITINVSKKLVKFGFENIPAEPVVYNGQVQKPEVFMIEDFYDVDTEGLAQEDLFVLVCSGTGRDAGTYNYYISGILNDNYTFDASEARCEFIIERKPIGIKWKDYPETYYDGYNHFPEYDFIEGDIISGDIVRFGFTLLECKAAGVYTINIDPSTISNQNYTANKASDFTFEIKKAKIKVIMHNATDRVQTKVGKRVEPRFAVIGNYYSYEDLQLIVVSEAKTASRSGRYNISCVLENKSYDAEVVSATYTLTGYYYVYYQLSNGTTYSERVEENQMPVGISKEDLNIPMFSQISYSDDYEVTGNDLYVAVTFKDYTTIVYGGAIVVVISVVYFIYYLKKRESKVR